MAATEHDPRCAPPVWHDWTDAKDGAAVCRRCGKRGGAGGGISRGSPFTEKATLLVLLPGSPTPPAVKVEV